MTDILEKVFTQLGKIHAKQKTLTEQESYLFDLTCALYETDSRFARCLVELFFPDRRSESIEHVKFRNSNDDDDTKPLFSFELYNKVKYMVFRYGQPVCATYEKNESTYHISPSRTAYLCPFGRINPHQPPSLSNGRQIVGWNHIWNEPECLNEDSSAFWNVEIGRAYSAYIDSLYYNMEGVRIPEIKGFKLKKNSTILTLLDVALSTVHDSRFTLQVEKERKHGFFGENNVGWVFRIHYADKTLLRMDGKSDVWGALLIYGYRTKQPRICIQFTMEDDGPQMGGGGPFNSSLSFHLTDYIGTVNRLSMHRLSFELDQDTLCDAATLHGNAGRLRVLCGFLLDVLTLPCNNSINSDDTISIVHHACTR